MSQRRSRTPNFGRRESSSLSAVSVGLCHTGARRTGARRPSSPAQQGRRSWGKGMQFDQSRDEWLISVDDHVIEPPDVWVTRLPAKHRDAGPRWVADAGGEAWLFGDERLA